MIQYDRRQERTGVQENRDYSPEFDVQCDFVMVYGFHDLEKRIKHWKEHGYIVHLMTGVSWGNYQDYLYGKFDGVDHHDEGQVNGGGNEINHGKDVPYMVPSVSFAYYLAQNLKKAVDAGVEAIHLEEPEFWVAAGYSEAFKREWQIYYKEPWQRPDSSAEAQYRASKLKRYLYTRTLDRLCSELKEYAMNKYGRLLRFYVPTHSLVNYSQWKIVSPESALVDLPTIDGYIAQIWTGTSRTANCYRGVIKERTLETALCEYGIMQELVRGTGRKMWYLHDPVEDDPRHTWKDYRYNYYRTVIASLFQPEIGTYEVAPWPARVMLGSHKSEDGTTDEYIPPEYKTNLLTVMHTLRDMEGQPATWDSNTQEVGIMLADSAMYQRVYPEGDPAREESQTVLWSPFYGISLPLIKQGLFVRPVQLDNVRRYAGYLNSYRTLVLSYEFMKPDSPDLHNAIASWVQEGGTLMVVGDGSDSFHDIRAWWNQSGADYANPTEHLYECLGLGRTPADGVYSVGKGQVCVHGVHPSAIAKEPEKCDAYLGAFTALMEAAKQPFTPGNDLVMRRGPYVVSAALDESQYEAARTINGTYIDMFSDELEVVQNPVLQPGDVALWYDVNAAEEPDILAASGRVEDYALGEDGMTFTLIGPSAMKAALRIRLPRGKTAATVSASVDGEAISASVAVEALGGTALVNFESNPAGVKVELKW
ncbi:MAG: DUF4350 domain-containing protein [Clostridia bacterium]|nr:DUF4350 domain-containing protein [Clostridia bacterium]